MISTNTSENTNRFGKFIAFGLTAKLLIFSIFSLHDEVVTMTRQEKIKAAQERIKELETLIKHFKK